MKSASVGRNFRNLGHEYLEIVNMHILDDRARQSGGRAGQSPEKLEFEKRQTIQYGSFGVIFLTPDDLLFVHYVANSDFRGALKTLDTALHAGCLFERRSNQERI